MEAINCIFCNTSSNNVVIQENGYDGKKCPQCDLIYVSPRPTKTEIANLYGHDGAQLSSHIHIGQGYSKRLQAHHHLKILSKYCKKGHLLEIGAGAGYFLAEAKKHNFKPFGIELNHKQADFMENKLNIPCETTALSPSSFAGKKFDIIYHCDVASHFYDPIDAFLQMHDTLDNNGILFFETGNIGDIDKQYYQLFDSFQYPDHLFFFSKKTLRSLMDNTGFEIIGYHDYSIIPQLLFNKALRSIKKQMHVKKHFKKTALKNINKVKKKSFFKQYAKHTYDYFQHALRYKIGQYTLKKNSPQTIIVVARKKKK